MYARRAKKFLECRSDYKLVTVKLDYSRQGQRIKQLKNNNKYDGTEKQKNNKIYVLQYETRRENPWTNK